MQILQPLWATSSNIIWLKIWSKLGKWIKCINQIIGYVLLIGCYWVESLSCFIKWPKDNMKNTSWATKTVSTTSDSRQQVEESAWVLPQLICPPLPWDTYYWPLSKVSIGFEGPLVHPAWWSLVWSVGDPSLPTHQAGENAALNATFNFHRTAAQEGSDLFPSSIKIWFHNMYFSVKLCE